VILQHLRDDSDLRVVVLYGDYSEEERTRAEAGFSYHGVNGPIYRWGQRQGHLEGLQSLCQVKLYYHHHAS
jgi:hypothetical protein